MLIRILLLAGLASIGFFIFLRRNRLPLHIMTVFLLLGAGAVAVIEPEVPQYVAEFVGVGRGADLVMYIAIVGVMFVLLHYYSKFVELQAKMTELVRQIAIMKAESQHRLPSPPDDDKA
jgi:small membrane protein